MKGTNKIRQIVVFLAIILFGVLLVGYTRRERIPSTVESIPKSNNHDLQSSPAKTPEDSIILTPTSVVNFDAKNWQTFTSTGTPISELKGGEGFSFRYPPELTLSYATGQDTVASFYTSDFDLIVNWSDSYQSPYDQATEFIDATLHPTPGSALDCNRLPTCDAKAFTVSQETLSSGLVAGEASGPERDGKIFQNYFIHHVNGPTINMYFTFKNSANWQKITRQILASIRFFLSEQ